MTALSLSDPYLHCQLHLLQTPFIPHWHCAPVCWICQCRHQSSVFHRRGKSWHPVKSPSVAVKQVTISRAKHPLLVDGTIFLSWLMLTILGNLILQAHRRSYTPHSGVKLTPDGSLLLILILSPTIRRFNCGESRLLPIPVRDLVGSSSFPSSCCINTPRSNHNAPKDQLCLQAPQRFWTVFFLLVFGLQFTVLYAHASPLVLGGFQNTSLRNVSLPILAIRHPTLELSLDPPGAHGDRGGRVGRSTLRIISSTNGTVLRLYTERTDLTRAYLTFSEDGQVQLTPNGTARETGLMLMSEGDPEGTYTDEVLILLADQPIILCRNSSKTIYAERLKPERQPDACFWQMHTGPSGLAFSSKSGKASDLLGLDFSNRTTRSTDATKEADGRFWRKPATWKIETLNHAGSFHIRSTLDALNSNSRSRRFVPLSTWILKRKINEAKEACRNLTEELRNQAQTLLKTVIKTRNRLFSLASWLSRPAVQSGIKPSGQGKNRRLHQTIFKALNNVVNTTYQVVTAERRKKRLAAEGRHREPSISISTAWTRRQTSSFEEHIRTRAEVSGLLYELRRERRVAVFDFYRTVRSQLNWPEERQRAWLINGTLPALIEELRTPRLQGRDFVDEKLYAAQHYLRNFIRLSKDTIKLPIGKAYNILVNRTMTVIQEDESPRDGSDRYTLWCEFMDYGG